MHFDAWLFASDLEKSRETFETAPPAAFLISHHAHSLCVFVHSLCGQMSMGDITKEFKAAVEQMKMAIGHTVRRAMYVSRRRARSARAHMLQDACSAQGLFCLKGARLVSLQRQFCFRRLAERLRRGVAPMPLAPILQRIWCTQRRSRCQASRCFTLFPRPQQRAALPRRRSFSEDQRTPGSGDRSAD